MNKNSDMEQTAYNFLYNRTKQIGNSIAKNYYGKKITYDEFRDEVSNVAKGFIGIGIGKQSRVGVIMPNVPETSYIQYGLNKIGAVSDFIDPRTKPIVLKDFVKNEKIDMIVCAEECYDDIILPIEDDLRTMIKIDSILTPSSTRSLPLGIKQLMELKKCLSSYNKKNNSIIDKISYNDFIKASKGIVGYTTDYEKDSLAIITHSSGTTGIPKPNPLTNENMNALVVQHDMLNLDLQSGMKFLHILPYFAAYGSVNCEHLGSCMGLEMMQVPVFSLENLAILVLKLKPNIIIGLPSWWESIRDSECMKNADLSFLNFAIAGGDSLDTVSEKTINEFLIKHGAHCILTKGHGMSEIAGCGTYAISKYNKLGDVGHPLPLMTYHVVDPETKKEIKFDGTKDIKGEAYISGPTLTPGMLDDKSTTNIDYLNGDRCVVSGDLITKRADGTIHFEERIDRGFSRFDGYKIHPSKIENCIKKHPAIKDCMVVQYYDESKFGNMPIIHVILNKEYETQDKESIIKEIIFETMQNDKDNTTRDIPTKWKFRDEIPLTLMQKQDYKSLINEGICGDEFTVVIEENNIKITSIEVLKPNIKNKIKIKS